MGLRHRPGVHENARPVLEGSVRLARPGSRAERIPAVQGADARCRPALPAGPRQRPGADAAAADARLARFGVRVSRHHPPPDRPRPFRRRSGRRLHRHRPVSARLRPLVRSWPETVRHRRHRRHPRRADDRRSRLPALGRARRRLGCDHRVPSRPGPHRQPDRHPHQPDDPAGGSHAAGGTDRGRTPLRSGHRALDKGGNRLPVDPGHQAANPGLRPD